MTVTVRDTGSSPVPFSVQVDLPLYATLVAQSGCSRQTYPQVNQATCTGTGVAAGDTRTFTLHINAPANADQTKIYFLPTARSRWLTGAAT